jgi:hypothetical protein
MSQQGNCARLRSRKLVTVALFTTDADRLPAVVQIDDHLTHLGDQGSSSVSSGGHRPGLVFFPQCTCSSSGVLWLGGTEPFSGQAQQTEA